MLPEMERRADRAATILAGLLTHTYNLSPEENRTQAVKRAVALAAALDAEVIRSFNEGLE